MSYITGLLVLLFGILLIQAVCLTEAFGSSQGGAQVQLAASRPTFYLAASEEVPRPPQTLVTSNLGVSPLYNLSTLSSMTPGSQQIQQGLQQSVSSWLSPY
jgi:hypothetical protein